MSPVPLDREHARSLCERIERVVDTLRDEVLVPFLGAGVSKWSRLRPAIEGQAEIPPDGSGATVTKEDRSFQPTIAHLKLRLARWLVDRTKGDDDLLDRALTLLGHPEPNNRATDRSPQAIAGCPSVAFGHLVEVCVWLGDQDKVCKVLGIEYLAELVPRPAHRFIAYLVREGLVTEVLTTNYDACIERALLASLGPRWPSRPGAEDMATVTCDVLQHHLSQYSGDEGTHDPVRVISSLGDHRQHGGVRRTRCGTRRPVLRLYKLNGCAIAYTHGSGSADSIALSERQLQGFRGNVWAHDLFRDRVRSRLLLFSGFGSDEPQIRHTVNMLSEELASDGARHGARHGPRDPRTPMVQQFGPRLTFNQHQVLAGFLDAGAALEEADEHAFLGGDAPYFGKATGGVTWSEPSSGLNADLFWHAVYLAAMRPLLRRYLGQRYPFYRWLQGLPGVRAAWVTRELIDWLYPPARSSSNAAAHLASGFGRSPRLFEPCPAKEITPPDAEGANTSDLWPYAVARGHAGASPPGPLRLQAWLWSVEQILRWGEASGPSRRDRYVPLRECSLTMFALLLFLSRVWQHWSRPNRPHEVPVPDLTERVNPTRGCGLRIELENTKPRPVDLFLVETGSPPPDDDGAPGAILDNGALVRQVTLPRLAGEGYGAIDLDRDGTFDLGGRIVRFFPADERCEHHDLRRVRICSYARLPLGALIADPAEPPSGPLPLRVRWRTAAIVPRPAYRMRRLPLASSDRSEEVR